MVGFQTGGKIDDKIRHSNAYQRATNHGMKKNSGIDAQPLIQIVRMITVGTPVNEGRFQPGNGTSPQSADPFMPQFFSAHLRGTAVMSGNSPLIQRARKPHAARGAG